MRGLVDGEAVDVIARHRASLFLDEIADAVREGLDDRFELARYAEHLAADAAGFDPLARSLTRRPTLLDRWIDELAEAAFAAHRPRTEDVEESFRRAQVFVGCAGPREAAA